MERPALQGLLADIRASPIDIVVIYKVDGLPRPLVDFARLVEIFDAQGASVVSVMQQFDRLARKSLCLIRAAHRLGPPQPAPRARPR